LKNSQGISLKQAIGIKNIFVYDWKQNFFADPKKKIASIPFIRNIIEFTQGEKDPSFDKLTHLLHWKDGSSTIKQSDLDKVYNDLFNTAGVSPNGNELVVDNIKREAGECLKAGDGVNFENKIVLSIAIRIFAEKFMVEKINDPNFVKGIDSNQTPKLLEKFKTQFPKENNAIEIVQRVILMTPENIHLNSFMYEPILDMSDDHLRKLYTDVLTL